MYKIESKPKYTIFAQKALHIIYLQVQNDPRRSFSIPLDFICKTLNIQNEHNAIDIVQNTLLELKKPIEFVDFYHPLEAKKYDWFITSIINNAGIYQRDNQWYAKIEINKLFFHFLEQMEDFPKQLMNLDELTNI